MSSGAMDERVGSPRMRTSRGGGKGRYASISGHPLFSPQKAKITRSLQPEDQPSSDNTHLQAACIT